MLVAGALGLVASGWLLGRQIGGPQGGRAFSRALATNLSIGLVALLLLEGAVRIAARTIPDGHHLERQLGPAVPRSSTSGWTATGSIRPICDVSGTSGAGSRGWS